MKIIEITALPNGAHRNQSGNFRTVPDGWAVIPESMTLENFPFGEVEAEEINGIMTVTAWVAGEIPEVEETTDDTTTEAEDTAAMLVDHEYRLTLLELGLTEF